MTWLMAVMAGVGVYMVAVPTPGTGLGAFLEQYLAPRPKEEEPQRRHLSFTGGRPVAVVGGAFLGLLAAQGDLFLAGRSRSSLALMILGGASGWVLWSMHETNARERRAKRLRYELPVVSDAMALHVVAGDSISGAMASVVNETSGVASEEMAAILAGHDAGAGLSDALAEASQVTAHGDATRLYETLSHAHSTGGRLADALGDLSIDYRAGLARDLVSEGGKRAIATYGPVLVLMVPTALVFLIYPTLLGLRALSGAP